MAINMSTALKIVKNKGKCYYTNKGNVYKAIKAYDEKWKVHGHVIYTIHPDKENIGKQYMCFVSNKGKNEKSVNKWTCEKIKEFEGNYYYTKNAKYRAYSLFDGESKYLGYVVYKYTNGKILCADFIPSVQKDINL